MGGPRPSRLATPIKASLEACARSWRAYPLASPSGPALVVRLGRRRSWSLGVWVSASVPHRREPECSCLRVGLGVPLAERPNWPAARLPLAAASGTVHHSGRRRLAALTRANFTEKSGRRYGTLRPISPRVVAKQPESKALEFDMLLSSAARPVSGTSVDGRAT